MKTKHKEFLNEVLMTALINNKNLKENDPIKLALTYNIQNSKANQTPYGIFNDQKKIIFPHSMKSNIKSYKTLLLITKWIKEFWVFGSLIAKIKII
ncbi:hypothetical protein OUS_1421 [Helicobacter pylori R056a]|nr:hypothetical protein OUS_1421 [Helicobacter pylori R056a]